MGLVPAYEKLYVERGELIHRRPQPAPEETWLYQEDGRINTWGKRGYNWREFLIHESDGWLVARPDLYVTEHCWVQDDVARLTCRWDVAGLVVAVEDGDYWGYWLYERGRLTDQFCQRFGAVCQVGRLIWLRCWNWRRRMWLPTCSRCRSVKISIRAMRMDLRQKRWSPIWSLLG